MTATNVTPPIEYATVPVTKLKARKGNSRRGDIDLIAESLAVNGQYRPIVANKRTSEVLAGNHTLLAAKKLKWKEIQVGWVDVDEETAKRIVLVDNRANDVATYDLQDFAHELEGVIDVRGTGYDDGTVNAIIEEVRSNEARDQELLGELVHPTGFDRRGVKGIEFGGDEEEDQEWDDDEEDGDPDDVSGYRLKTREETGIFHAPGKWGMPELRHELLVTADELPGKLDVWGGWDSPELEHQPDDEEAWFLYNYGVDSARGLPYGRFIPVMYTHDRYFESWWQHPDKNLARMLAMGVTMMIEPEFSTDMDVLDVERQWDMSPLAVRAYQLYRDKWIARYVQEAGVKVIPSINHSAVTDVDFAFEGLPTHRPVEVFSIEVQTGTYGTGEDDEVDARRATYRRVLRHVVDTYGMRKLIAYGGTKGHDLVRSCELGDGVEVVYVQNRVNKRRGVAFDFGKGGRSYVESTAQALGEEQ